MPIDAALKEEDTRVENNVFELQERGSDGELVFASRKFLSSRSTHDLTKDSGLLRVECLLLAESLRRVSAVLEDDVLIAKVSSDMENFADNRSISPGLPRECKKAFSFSVNAPLSTAAGILENRASVRHNFIHLKHLYTFQSLSEREREDGSLDSPYIFENGKRVPSPYVRKNREIFSEMFSQILRPRGWHPPENLNGILSWNGGKVTVIAQGIIADYSPDVLPILADALEDAGCDDKEMLNACRQSEELSQARWVLDLLTRRRSL